MHHILTIAPSNRGLDSPQGGLAWYRGIWRACYYVRFLSSMLYGINDTTHLFASHGRDNKIHLWQRPTESVSIRQGGAASLTDQPPPPLRYSLDVNALNFCRFSLLPSPSSDTALIAVPNLVESALVGFANRHPQLSCERAL